jgi:predicted nucleic acid-binding protein
VIIVSDTNILSSLAAGDALPVLLRLFVRSTICIPPGVHQELQAGLERGKTYLEPVIQAIKTRHIEVVPLPSEEEQLTLSSPLKLNVGERQAIALAQICKASRISMPLPSRGSATAMPSGSVAT